MRVYAFAVMHTFKTLFPCRLQSAMALSRCPALNVVRLNYNALTTVAGLEGETPALGKRDMARHGSILNFILKKMRSSASSVHGFLTLLMRHEQAYVQYIQSIWKSK